MDNDQDNMLDSLEGELDFIFGLDDDKKKDESQEKLPEFTIQ